jgi:uncharacterized protein (TIGR02594 family)
MAVPSASYADTDRFGTESPYANMNAHGKVTQKPQKKSRLVQRADIGLASFSGGMSNPHWVSVAKQYTGTNPTGRRSLWCADFMNLVLKRSGMQGTNSSMARSFADYGRRISGPRVGAIAVLGRGKNGGHVGIVTGIDPKGNPILISGNHNNTVAEAAYPAGRVIAYVWPAG